MRRARLASIAALLRHSGVTQEARLLTAWLEGRLRELAAAAAAAAAAATAVTLTTASPAKEESPEDSDGEEEKEKGGDRDGSTLFAAKTVDLALLSKDGDLVASPSPSRLLVNVWRSAQKLVEFSIRSKASPRRARPDSAPRGDGCARLTLPPRDITL